MEIKNLKVGDYVYSFSSSLMNKNKPHNDYSFFQIIGDTPKQWKVRGEKNIRKLDLKIIGSVYCFECMHIMDETAWNMKAIQDKEQEVKPNSSN